MKLAATHADGRRLYSPEWDTDGDIVPSTKPIAAVSIDRDGVTFPPGSIWIRNAEGWTWAKDYRETPPAITASRIRPLKIAKKNLTKHRCECEVCGKIFYA
jgi:hypothetical protein